MRESVFYKMAQLNCPIYEMKSKKVSLEEIFLELTASDKPVSEVSESAEEEIHNSDSMLEIGISGVCKCGRGDS